MRKIAKKIHNNLFGWKIVGKIPDNIDSAILFGYPHTSAWDGFYMSFFQASDSRYKLVFKNSGIFGLFAKSIDQITVKRNSNTNQTDQIAKIIKERENEGKKTHLIICPEGTRKYTNYISSGFYYIAVKSKCPIIGINYDYKNKILTISDTIIWVTSKKGKIIKTKYQVLDILKEWFKNFPNSGKIPENAGKLQFRN